jgi:hypothetical protein
MHRQAVEVYSPALGSPAQLTVSNEDGTTLADLAAGADFYPLPETGLPILRAMADSRRLSPSMTPDLVVTPVTVHNVLARNGRAGSW